MSFAVPRLRTAPITSFAITPDSDRPQEIKQSHAYTEKLRNLVHSVTELQKLGYIIYQLSRQDLDRKRRCVRCGRRLPHSFKRTNWMPKTATSVQGGNGGQSDEQEPKGQKETVLHCKYHPGRVFQRRWSCCDGAPGSPPCQGSEDHTPRTYAVGELEQEWRYYETPYGALHDRKAAAVVIDCEMGTASTGETELIRVSAVDYFSGAVLLDSLVYPDVKMVHYNTRYSGITRQQMENARRARSCLFGRASARQALWKFIGPTTIVIGHGGNSDFSSLRWIHPVIIDTFIIEKNNRPPEEDNKDKKKDGNKGEGEAKEGGKQAEQSPEAPIKDATLKEQEKAQKAPNQPRQRGGLSLKALAKERLGRDIQLSHQGHDSVEDSIAARDILHWNILKLLEDGMPKIEIA
ncbi:ribonuclease H-like domain-containing protein [Trichoderma austrokoningii]